MALWLGLVGPYRRGQDDRSRPCPGSRPTVVGARASGEPQDSHRRQGPGGQPQAAPSCTLTRNPLGKLTTDASAFPPAGSPWTGPVAGRARAAAENQPSREPTNEKCRKPQMMCKKIVKVKRIFPSLCFISQHF